MKFLPYNKNIFLVFAFTYLGCSPQTDTAEQETKIVKLDDTQTAAVTDAESSPEVTIAIGAAKGSKVVALPGSIPIGGQLSATGSDTPAEFEANQNAVQASNALSVEVLDASGNSLSELPRPMSIALPFEGTSLFGLAATEKTVENLCMFLKTKSGKLFVWRNQNDGEMTIDAANKKAQVQSKFIGVFQLFYCGAESPGDSFTDVQDSEEIMEDGVTLSEISLSFDTTLIPSGADHYCAFVFRENEDETTNLLAVGTASISNAMEDLSLSFNNEEIAETDLLFFSIAFQSASQTCALTVGSDLSNGDQTFTFQENYFFSFTPAEFDAGVSGTFGSGDFALAEVQLFLGVPSGASVIPANTSASNHASPACVRGVRHQTSETNQAYGVEISTTLNSDGTFGSGSSSLLVPFPGQDSDKVNLSVVVGRSCQDTPVAEDATTAKSYVLYWSQVLSQAHLYLTPVQMSIASAQQAKACIEVYPPNTVNAAAATSTAAPIAHFLVTAGNATPYDVYIPYHTEKVNTGGAPLYDMIARFVTSCYEGGVESFPLPNSGSIDKELNANFSL